MGEKMQAEENREFLASYHQILEQIDLSKLPKAIKNTDINFLWGSNNRLCIAYLYWPNLNRLLLLEPLRISDNKEKALREEVLGRHRELLSQLEDRQRDLARVAARSYPFLMVLDQDAWLAIQKDQKANLALSPEEAELLDSVRRMRFGYPLFINGRAGSGKSTMLQYLAADYLDFALRRNLSHQVLYLTSSRDLMEHARKIVRSLLTVHHSRLLEGAPDPAKVDEAIDRTFRVFHDFLCSLLPVESQEQLPPDKYVDYARFRHLWHKEFAKRPEARRMSPEIA